MIDAKFSGRRFTWRTRSAASSLANLPFISDGRSCAELRESNIERCLSIGAVFQRGTIRLANRSFRVAVAWHTRTSINVRRN